MATGIDRIDRDHPTAAALLELRESPPIALDPLHLTANGVCALDSLDPRSRSFILLRTQILNGFHASGGRILAVTSTDPGNGKTFAATNLAVALSRVQPVMLVDLDLSKPAVADRMGLTPTLGVDDYLAGDATLESCRYRIADLQLSVLPVRQHRIDAAAMLAGDRLERLFRDLHAMADDPICIVDTPPTIAIDEIVAIAGAVEGIMMVVEEGATHADDLREAMAMFEPTPVIGTLLNKSIGSMFRRRKSYYYYGYGDRSPSSAAAQAPS